MSAPRIRHANEADLAAMTGLISQLFALEADFSFNPDKVQRGLCALLQRPAEAGVWVAEFQGEVVGMCTAQIVISTAEGGPVAWVEDVVVAQAHRQRGIGRCLLDAVEAWAEARQLHRLQLLADHGNASALAFYQRQRWQATRLICLRRMPDAPGWGRQRKENG